MVSPAFVVATMARRGLLKPGPPHRVVQQFLTLGRWGYGLAGELRQAAVRSPSQVAVIDASRSLTYGELLSRSSRLASVLPVSAGDRVGVLCRNSAALLETLFAVASVGADPVLINTGLSASQLSDVVVAQDLKVVVHDPAFAGLLPGFSGAISTSSLDALISGAPADVSLAPPSRAGRTIVLTSGTTGLPKGAQRPTPNGFGPLCSIIDRIPLRAGVRMMIAAPLFHTWAFAGLQIALALRATVVLRPRFEPLAALDAMRASSCTALIAVPVMLQSLMELSPDVPLPALSVAAVSGSALPGGLATRFMDRYGDILYNLYGSTEASWVSIATPADMREAPDTAGRPPHGTAVAVLDEYGSPVPQGTTGRLFVGNEMLFEGYTNGSSRELRDGLLATGDLGHLDAAGRVFVDGREDDMIISGGENVFPSEVEDLLAALPEVLEVAVIGVPDDEYGQRLAAYVVLRSPSFPSPSLDADDIRAHVRANRARFCVPRDVVFLPALPRNATGKVLKRDLPR